MWRQASMNSGKRINKILAVLLLCGTLYTFVFLSSDEPTTTRNEATNFCLAPSPLLTGSTNVNFEDGSGRTNWPPTFDEINQDNLHLQAGGFYPGPSTCTPKATVAIIIPYRDRDVHLRFQLHYLLGILFRQQTRHVIIVAEQEGLDIFNKGQLMNTAFNYVMKELMLEVDCVFFHDVDSISEDDRTLYECRGNNEVVHLSHRMDKFNYRFCCGVTVGGVLGMLPAQFAKVNGFSNIYSGWGGEDDDMNARLTKLGGYKIYRPVDEYNRYAMVHHKRDADNPNNDYGRRLYLKWKQRQPNDGLNSLETQVTSVVKHPTHTRLYIQTKHINVDDWLGEEQPDIINQG
ncbi:beta-1,4-galactosyltransferase 2-like [Ciona intestinalis]